MSTIINGTSNAITFPDSTVQTTAFTATPALTSVTTTGGANFATAGGSVGIGVTPSSWANFTPLQLTAASVAGYAGSNNAYFGANYYSDGTTDKYINTGYAERYIQTGGQHIWQYSASGTANNAITFNEAMRIDSSGNLLVGTTSRISSSRVSFKTAATNENGLTVECTSTSGFTAGIFSRTGSDGTAIAFNRGGGDVGTISITTTATAYNTSSDYRLKENIAPMTGALATVSALKPVTYTWKSDGSNGQGFIAHELQEVVPDCVTGEKDAVDEDGKPKYQGIDVSFLVATLTAAIQEQQVMIEELKAKVTALESK